MHDMIQAARVQASAAYNAARQHHNSPRGYIEYVWNEVQRRNRAATSDESKLAEARTAAAVMLALAGLDDATRQAIFAVEARRDAQGTFDDEEVAARAKVIAAHPVLGPFQAELEEADLKRAAEIEAGRQAAEEQAIAAAPSKLLIGLRSRGLELVLGEGGKTLAMRREHLEKAHQSELDEITRLNPGLIAVLRAEQEAARPVVIA